MSKPQTDIFGEPQTEPDISTEALDWVPADEFDSGELGDDGESLHTGEGTDNTNDEDDEGAEEGAENGTDTPAATDTENAISELPEQFRGKSAAELVKIIQDSQGFISQQGNQIGELRQVVEQIQQAQAATSVAEAVPASEYIDNVQDALLAYREGIQMLDRGELGPKSIDEIIDVVRDLDPVTAAKMDRDFGMRLARAEMHQTMAPVIQQSYNDALTQATARVNTDPDAEAYREDIVRIVQKPQTFVEQQIAAAYQNARTAPDIEAALTAALTNARGSDPLRSAAFKSQLQNTKQNEAVEHGNASPAEVPQTDAERVIASLLKPKDPTADLFAGFGG